MPPFPSYPMQKGASGRQYVHIEYRSLFQEGNHRTYQESCVPLMSAIPSLLKYEINEVEFNFRVYKFIMCSSFLLPLYMAGWGWQTCFVSRAALEFWLNEALTPSPVPPLISTSSREKVEPLLSEAFSTGNVHLFCFPGGRLWGVFPNWTSDWLPSRGRTAPVPWPQLSFLLSGAGFFPQESGCRAAGGSDVGSQEEKGWRVF